jgi:hypothetical protein
MIGLRHSLFLHTQLANRQHRRLATSGGINWDNGGRGLDSVELGDMPDCLAA